MKMFQNEPLSSYPVNRIILVGASNLTLSLRMIIQHIQGSVGGPSEILVAAGHGRSYGLSSQVMIRELPGIVRCGLWEQLSTRVIIPSYALLTDIGNDIPYGVCPEQILQWVTWCVDELTKASAQIVITNLPIESIEALSNRRFQFFRHLFFPSCTLSRIEVVSRAKVVYQGIATLAQQKQLILCEQSRQWMGADGFHVAFMKREQVFRQLCNHFVGTDEDLSSATKQSELRLSWQQRPRFALQRVWGKEKCCQQPSGLLSNQATVSLY